VQAAGKEEMRSGWFWGTEMWQQYLQEYAKTRPECLHEWRSSPLADDHEFGEALSRTGLSAGYKAEEHQSQVIDLRTHKWSDVRKGHKSNIKTAEWEVTIKQTTVDTLFPFIHRAKFGTVRNDGTYNYQRQWIRDGYAMLVVSYKLKDALNVYYVSAVLWIIYQGGAYYASSPSLQKNIQHAVVYRSFNMLQERGVRFVDMGQIDGEEETRGEFKTGFGGEAKPFTIVRRTI
jgi:hypothetical protein